MAAIDGSGHSHRLLKQQEYDRKIDQENRDALWTFIWVLFGFKVVSIGVLVYWIEWSEIKYLIGLTTWPWFVVPAVALTPPVINRLRLRRVRRRREQLRRAEFEVESAQTRGDEFTLTLLDAHGQPIEKRNGTDST